MCSCWQETRISGGPAVLWVGFRKNGLTWIGPGGEPTWYATWPTLRRGFCPRCGTHLVSIADDSNMIMVTGFSLDDRSGTDPVSHSFRGEAAPWMNHPRSRPALSGARLTVTLTPLEHRLAARPRCRHLLAPLRHRSLRPHAAIQCEHSTSLGPTKSPQFR
ncbi:GFA family protein [Streptomyces sp. NPDC006458]|uniref:GFA family protein n=1 Tax=Streptomyces sp. NPDC006458 TaxID=3154302 RepID=UPI0033BBCBF6